MAAPYVAPAVPVEPEHVPRPVAEQVTVTIGAGKHVEDKGEEEQEERTTLLLSSGASNAAFGFKPLLI